MCFLPISAAATDSLPDPVSSGWSLCRALVNAVDSVLTKPSEQFFAHKAAVINAVKSLLSVSVSAKMAGLEGTYFYLSSSFIQVVDELDR